ncbi:MAG: hypothetical protein CL693_18810 [Cellvibrionaceae bacterium]|nr:hypothetical protein [Cellvibrionaceae bacterium]
MRFERLSKRLPKNLAQIAFNLGFFLRRKSEYPYMTSGYALSQVCKFFKLWRFFKNCLKQP